MIKLLQLIARAKHRSDYCHDSKSAFLLVANERYFQMIKQLRTRGIKQRFVTEVTRENIQSCKELDKHVELRHLDGVKGTFEIVDGREYGASTKIYDLQTPTQFVYSNIKSFVNQQQYLFEMLWSRALPAQYKIKEIEEGIPIERSEIIEGTENVIKKLIEGFSKIRETFDNCIDSSCPSAYVSTDTVWRRCIGLSRRGVKLRFITEITKDNITYCKEMMRIAELRHLDKVKGNFGIADKKDYRGTATMEEGKPPTQAIRSTVKSFVDQQQYFFETLWNKAIPAEKKIREIEEGIPPEITEVWYGSENILKKSWEIISRAKVSSDYCHNSKTPSIFVTNPHYLRAMMDLTKRGVKHRFLTEITKYNIEYCKELAKYVELRHVDGVKGSFSIIDGKEYGADPNPSELQPPTEFVYSNVKKFVDQQQYFFETLWNKAIPAEQRIREVEEGVPPETVRTLNNPAEIQTLANKLVCSAKKELLIVFPTAAEFYRQHNDKNGFLRKLTLLQTKNTGSSKKRRTVGTLDTRITVPGTTANNNLDYSKNLLAQTIQGRNPSACIRSEIRYVDIALSINVAVIIVDRKHSLVIEINDDKGSDSGGSDYIPKSNDAILKGRKRSLIQQIRGLAIYTNSRALVMSTVSMFELLWTHIELYEELKLRDMERREFIDIAAHELRGPIQPIVGLAKEIRSRYDLGKDDKMLGAILRSAANLQTLANNILDVARIESKSLELKISKFDLITLVRAAIDDFRHELLRKNALKIRFKSNNKRLFISADRGRIYQVIYNLIANAIKFTDRGLISISAIKKDGKVIFSVRDTGQGIDEKVIPKLFSKFNTSLTTSGTGLGLFISRRIINAHGGDIYGINNRETGIGEGGATFTFTLPLNRTRTTIKTHNVGTRE